MGVYILRRILYMIPVLLAVSILSFIIIQLPPGDYLTTKMARLQLEQGSQASEEEMAAVVRAFSIHGVEARVVDAA